MLLAASVMWPATVVAQTAAGPRLVFEAKFPLGDVSGRIDHLSVDVKRQRLFVAELGNNSLGVIDLAAGKVLRRIDGLSEPQGVAYVRFTDSVFVANAGDGSVRVLRGDDLTLMALSIQDGHLAATVETCGDADDVFVDPKRRRVYVSCGEGVIDVLEPGESGYQEIARVPTVSGARTALFVPELDRLFVAVRAGWNEPAAIWVFRPTP